MSNNIESITCWSCTKLFTAKHLAECDGCCPHCNQPVDTIDDEERNSAIPSSLEVHVAELQAALSGVNSKYWCHAPAVKAVIEALEQRHKQVAYWCNLNARKNEEIGELRQRIAELEESHAQVIHSRDHYKRISSEGLKLLGQPAVNPVKVPDVYWCDHLSGAQARLSFKESMRAAGIQVEGD